MACFLVPAAEAVVTTVVVKVMQSKEEAAAPVSGEAKNGGVEMETRLPFVRKLKWLTNMLWGGSVLLAFEHLWHGEVVPWFPFLTAAANPKDASVMLHEMSTVGVSMAVLVTLVWVGMLAVANMMEKKALDVKTEASQEGLL